MEPQATYTDEEIFTLLDMQFGAPPAATPRMGETKATADYYNDVTSLLMAIFPNDLIRMIRVRKAFYEHHGHFLYDVVDMPERRR